MSIFDKNEHIPITLGICLNHGASCKEINVTEQMKWKIKELRNEGNCKTCTNMTIQEMHANGLCNCKCHKKISKQNDRSVS